MKTQKEWFETWFDSPYYHKLYKHRDHQEAEQYISKLVDFLNPKPTSHFLDLACGKGRHALQLNQLGYTVTGLDLSKNSIEHARKFENEKLKFGVHDMREVYQSETFNYILSSFTSFGYFNNIDDNLKMIQSVYVQLKTNGIFVIDFLNEYLVRKNLIEFETRTISNTKFEIRKNIDSGKVIKTIGVLSEKEPLHFEERVQLFSKDEIDDMLSDSGFEVVSHFGNYQLDAFKKETSSRFIVVAKK